MHKSDIFFPSELIVKIVRCVEDAVGDDIRADISQEIVLHFVYGIY